MNLVMERAFQKWHVTVISMQNSTVSPFGQSSSVPWSIVSPTRWKDVSGL